MRRKFTIGLAIAGFLAFYMFYSFSQITPQEIENAPEWIDLETALQLAEDSEDEKLVLIDIFEVGCRFCRQMEREVYPSESIRMLIDNRFIPVKVNGNSEQMMIYKGERISQQQFASLMGVSAFPYTVVMDSQGNVIDKRRGYMGITDLSRFLNNAFEEV